MPVDIGYSECVCARFLDPHEIIPIRLIDSPRQTDSKASVVSLPDYGKRCR